MPSVPSSVILPLGAAGFVAGLAGVVTNVSVLGFLGGTAALAAGLIARNNGNGEVMTTASAMPVEVAAAFPTEKSVGAAAAFAPRAATWEAESVEMEEDVTAERNEPDALTDPATGLYTENYLMVALDARIAAARRRLRPVALALVEVAADLAGDSPSAGDPVDVSEAIRSTIRAADTASRFGDGRYAIVLEDTPENGAIWTIERLRAALVSAHPNYTVWAGVACYPSHAFNVDEIMQQASNALNQAREWRQDRIEVATSD